LNYGERIGGHPKQQALIVSLFTPVGGLKKKNKVNRVVVAAPKECPVIANL